jgi:hypothetical protein
MTDSTDCVCGCPSDEHCLDLEHCHFDETRSSGTTCFRHDCDCDGYWPIDRKDERPPKPPHYSA